MRKTSFALLAAAALGLGACGHSTGDGAVSGGLIGAGAGAGVAALTGGSVGSGALIGGAAGAAGGALTSGRKVNLGRPALALNPTARGAPRPVRNRAPRTMRPRSTKRLVRTE